MQFLKARIQRGVNTEDNSFLMFIAGELITDIFTLIHKMLKVLTTFAFVLPLMQLKISLVHFICSLNFAILGVAKGFIFLLIAEYYNERVGKHCQ